MKILFYPYNCIPFHADTLDEQPLGGVETCVIRLARALDALGHEVYVISELKNLQETAPRYLSAEKAWRLGEFDLMIGVRAWEAFWQPFKAKKKFLWTGDAFTNTHTIGIGDPRVYALFDRLLCVSEWQRETLCKASGFPKERAFLLPTGVDLSEFLGHEERKRKRLIYSSNPQRGLIYLPTIFNRLKEKHPDLELHIFSNGSLYDMRWPPKVGVDVPYLALLDMMRALPGCTIHGTVLQKELAREFMKSSILAYPCRVYETSCITVIEAQAAGCVVVTSSIGALPETTGEAGIIIQEEPGTDLFIEKFIMAVDKLLENDSDFQRLSQKAQEQSKLTDWKIRALQLIKLYESF